MNDEVALSLPSQRRMIFQDSEVEMRYRVGVLETDVDNAVGHGFPPERAKMLRDIVFRTHLDLLCRALSGDPPARKKPGAVLETDVDIAVDHGSPPECAKMLREIVFRTHLDVLCRALSGDPPARKKPGAVRFYSGARVVRAKPPPELNRLRWSAPEFCPDCCSVVTTSLSSRWPGKGRGRRRAPGSQCRACLVARRPCCEKSSRRCG